mmetsp:Transcript_17934/g.24840  ORF Transcript_17934/g.24840 Transcript_17934/m.24840 type:complete len:339 (-) Transcript_17934:40-1056(-)
MALGPSALRIGPSTTNAGASSFLRNALLSHFKTMDSSSLSPQEAAKMLTVTNRYFSAQLLLEDLDSANSNIDGDIKEDGIILVFDALHSNPDRTVDGSAAAASGVSTFNGLTAIHEQATSLDQCGELLRLCVGVSLGEMTPSELRGGNHEEEYSRRVLWCLDRGYEYVEADLSEEGRQKGHDDRDKDGFARVVEAIATTVWSSAKMGHGNNSSGGRAMTTKATLLNNVEEKKEATAPQPPSSANNYSSKSNDNGTESPKDGVDNEVAQEKVFEDMEKLLVDVSKIREASKAGAFSDEERRKRAGDAATLMMGLMEKFECDDDSQGDYGDSSDDNSICA